MTLDIVFDIQSRLLGTPQAPDRPLRVRSNTPDGVALPLPAVAPSCTSAQEIWDAYAPIRSAPGAAQFLCGRQAG